ncbi:MAG: Hsp33 family molecular chaperone HslO [Mycoplasmataceae bacterium]|nr:Hsp33 family molecular chaperone HslO [Mycoplasmataceae bacterium]
MKQNFTKIILKNNVLIYLSDLKDVVNQILTYHKYLPLPNLILGNAILAFSPLKFIYKSNKLMIRYKTNGAMKSLILEINENKIRGLVSNPNIETEYDQKNFNSIPLILGIGDDGIVEISREIKGNFFTSEVKIAKADIVTDLVYFLNKSDQIYSAAINDFELNEKDSTMANKAKNIIFQLLPNHSEEDKIWIENFIKDNNFKNYSINEIIEKIDGQIISTEFLEGICWCNKDKIINAINLLKNSEIEDLFSKDKQIEVVCEFCMTKRLFEKKDFKINE